MAHSGHELPICGVLENEKWLTLAWFMARLQSVFFRFWSELRTRSLSESVSIDLIISQTEYDSLYAFSSSSFSPWQRAKFFTAIQELTFLTVQSVSVGHPAAASPPWVNAENMFTTKFLTQEHSFPSKLVSVLNCPTKLLKINSADCRPS